MKKQKVMIYERVTPESFKNGKWIYRAGYEEVIVMAVVDRYAMVRYKGCYPFVVSVRDLSDPKDAADGVDRSKLSF